MNLIVTCPRYHEEDAADEVSEILRESGDENPSISVSYLPGILTAKTSLNPIDFVKSLRKRILDEPWSVRYCLRVIPIQEKVEAILDEISQRAATLAKCIESNQSYRITVEKRDSELSSKSIVEKIAKNLPNKVSLESPDWIILVEIIGKDAGVSVIKEDWILSVPRTKRTLSD